MRPLRAELLVHKDSPVAELLEDLSQRMTVGHGRLGLDTDLVAAVAGSLLRHALMGQRAQVAILPDTQQLRPRPQIAPGGVVQSIVLKGAGRIEMEAKLRKAGLKCGGIGDGEF